MFGVCNIKKVKRTDLYGLRKEANRTREEHENGLDLPRTRCDWDRTAENVYLVHSDNWEWDIKARVKEAGQTKKIRDDAVYALSMVITASPEFFEGKSKEEALDYFRTVLAEAVEIYGEGDPSRVINAVAHFDEKTPHLHALLTPLHTREKDGQTITTLNAKKVVGGVYQMHRAQERLYKNVFSRYGFERGEITLEKDPEERRKHQDTHEHYEAQRQTTLEEARAAEKLVAESNQCTLNNTAPVIKEAVEATQELTDALNKASRALTKQGQEHRVKDAVERIEHAVQSMERGYMAQINNTSKTEKLLANTEQTVDQIADTKLKNARTKLAAERKTIRKDRQRLKDKEQALEAKEQNIEQEIERRAQKRSKEHNANLLEAFREYLGEAFGDFLSFYAQKKEKALERTQSPTQAPQNEEILERG